MIKNRIRNDKLLDYFNRAKERKNNHTPHILEEALSWHDRFIKKGNIKI